jgi:hypothetical protein
MKASAFCVPGWWRSSVAQQKRNQKIKLIYSFK